MTTESKLKEMDINPYLWEAIKRWLRLPEILPRPNMIGSEIRRMRKDAGLTQVQLAKLVGVGNNTVPRWERGELTPPKNVLDLVYGACLPGLDMYEAVAVCNLFIGDVLGSAAVDDPLMPHKLIWSLKEVLERDDGFAERFELTNGGYELLAKLTAYPVARRKAVIAAVVKFWESNQSDDTTDPLSVSGILNV
jgi:transcriptional regulator with XRE-family HTH domain